jgi:hypothetical protein
VISGDTLVLVGKPGPAAAGPPKEITVTLASLVAPSISRGPRQASEDPFAWESREFLRNLCIGKLRPGSLIPSLILNFVLSPPQGRQSRSPFFMSFRPLTAHLERSL